MFDNGKLSLWDIFNNLSIGLATLLISAYPISLYIDFDKVKTLELLSKFTTVLVITLPVLLLLLGMLIDALSNKFCHIQDFIYRIEKRTPRDQPELKAKVRIIVPEIVSEKTMFRFCKAFVLQNCKNNNVDVFLARFGFYRNFSFVIFTFSFFSYPIHSSILLSIFIFFISRVFMVRSYHFLSLLESEVYYNYLVAKVEKDF
ncbi:TPA: hypothetical protein ACN362_000901 [Vibrio parahaemolyticus]